MSILGNDNKNRALTMKDRHNKRRKADDRRNNERVFAKLDITAIIKDKEASTIMRNLSDDSETIK